VYAGTYLSSLNGNGFSISLLNVTDNEFKHTLLQLLDAQSQCIGWSMPLNSTTWSRVAPSTSPQKNNPTKTTSQSSSLKCDIADVQSRLERGLDAVIAAEPEITRYDDIVGDGDCGTTMKRGAEGRSTHH
jgi:triose/dihydroxyacetone kinase / FAD-AMP lyase (cyclizing)